MGGILIPDETGLEGHSDADVLLHAVMDALLGAAALGDIGDHFPDTDEQYRGVSSVTLLRKVAFLLKECGYRIGNIDVMVLAEQPKLAPYKKNMVRLLARELLIGEKDVSIKATTMERMGFVGRREGIAVEAVALLLSSED